MTAPEFTEHRVQRGDKSLRVIETGNPGGQPLIFFHGGPGAGLDKNKVVLFGTDNYRVIFFDQRGVGGSSPRVVDANSVDELNDNTTAHTLDDAVAIRQALGISQPWVVAGGSFGSTLSLLYAMKYPEDVAGMLIYGIFLCRFDDLRFFDPDGFAAQQRPQDYARFLKFLPEEERGNPVGAYERRFWSVNAEERDAAARSWTYWNQGLFLTRSSPEEATSREALDHSLTMARLFTYYKRNDMFLERVLGPSPDNNQILENLQLLPKVPIEILNGDADLVTTVDEAELLHTELTGHGFKTRLSIVQGVGHSTSEPGYVPALSDASDRLYQQLQTTSYQG